MHEMSLAINILNTAQTEAVKHGATRLTLVQVRYGCLANMQPEAMQMAFSALILDTPHFNAKLILVEEKLRLRCYLCSHIFQALGREDMFGLCPACGKSASYFVEAGEGIFLDHLEAE